MKTLKSFKVILALMVFTILAGCSDQITSSGETGSSEKGEGVISQNSPIELPLVQKYTFQVRLKPNNSYTLNDLSTGFDRFYSIDIYEIVSKLPGDKKFQNCSDLRVYSNKKSKVGLSCSSSGFELSEITIENLSSSFRDLEVIVSAFKQSKVPKDPKSIN